MQNKTVTFTEAEIILIRKTFSDIKNFYLDDSEKVNPPRSMDCIINVFSQEEINNIYSINEKLS